MSQEVKATEVAERKAQELGVNVASVQGTGADGQVKVEDVERAAKAVEGTVEGAEVEGNSSVEEATEGGDAERLFEARLNPELGDQTSVRIGEKTYVDGTPMSESEYESLKAYKSSPSVDHPSGVQYIKRGPEIAAS